MLAFGGREGLEFSPDFRLHDAQDILFLCSSMITIGKTNVGSTVAEVRLAHTSVRDFLVNLRAEISNASTSTFQARIVHEKIACACFAYFQYLGKPDLDEISIRDNFPLAKYAVQNWMFYAREAEGSNEICGLALKLLKRDEVGYQRLFQFYNIDRAWQIIETKRDLSGIGRRRRFTPTTTISPLYYASFAGLIDIVRSLLERGEQTNNVCGFFGDALSAVVSQVHLSHIILCMDRFLGSTSSARVD